MTSSRASFPSFPPSFSSSTVILIIVLLIAAPLCHLISAAVIYYEKPSQARLDAMLRYQPPGCHYQGKKFAHGEQVVTTEPCLNCNCKKGVLLCYLRVCPAFLHTPQNESCTTVRPAGQCCPTVVCESEDSSGAKTTTTTTMATTTLRSHSLSGTKGDMPVPPFVHQEVVNELDFSGRNGLPSLGYHPQASHDLSPVYNPQPPNPVFVPQHSSTPSTTTVSSTPSSVTSTTTKSPDLVLSREEGDQVVVTESEELSDSGEAETTTLAADEGAVMYVRGSSTPNYNDDISSLDEDEDMLAHRLPPAPLASDSDPPVVSGQHAGKWPSHYSDGHESSNPENELTVSRENMTTILHTSPATYIQDSSFVVTSSPSPASQESREGDFEEAEMDLQSLAGAGGSGSPSTSDLSEEFLRTIRGGCLINGTIYAEGSAVISSSFCEYCYCIRSKRMCIRPRCHLSIMGCMPRYASEFACCPTSYACGDSILEQPTTLMEKTSSSSTTSSPGAEAAADQDIARPLNYTAVCEDGERAYRLGERMTSNGTCETCFCGHGGERHCQAEHCAAHDQVPGCVPVIPEGHCCPTEYKCISVYEKADMETNDQNSNDEAATPTTTTLENLVDQFALLARTTQSPLFSSSSSSPSPLSPETDAPIVVISSVSSNHYHHAPGHFEEGEDDHESTTMTLPEGEGSDPESDAASPVDISHIKPLVLQPYSRISNQTTSDEAMTASSSVTSSSSTTTTTEAAPSSSTNSASEPPVKMPRIENSLEEIHGQDREDDGLARPSPSPVTPTSQQTGSGPAITVERHNSSSRRVINSLLDGIIQAIDKSLKRTSSSSSSDSSLTSSDDGERPKEPLEERPKEAKLAPALGPLGEPLMAPYYNHYPLPQQNPRRPPVATIQTNGQPIMMTVTSDMRFGKRNSTMEPIRGTVIDEKDLANNHRKNHQDLYYSRPGSVTLLNNNHRPQGSQSADSNKASILVHSNPEARPQSVSGIGGMVEIITARTPEDDPLYSAPILPTTDKRHKDEKKKKETRKESSGGVPNESSSAALAAEDQRPSPSSVSSHPLAGLASYFGSFASTWKLVSRVHSPAAVTTPLSREAVAEMDSNPDGMGVAPGMGLDEHHLEKRPRIETEPMALIPSSNVNSMNSPNKPNVNMFSSGTLFGSHPPVHNLPQMSPSIGHQKRNGSFTVRLPINTVINNNGGPPGPKKPFGSLYCFVDGKTYSNGAMIDMLDPCMQCKCFYGRELCQRTTCPPPPAADCVSETVRGFCCPRFTCGTGNLDQSSPSIKPGKNSPAELAAVAANMDKLLNVEPPQKKNSFDSMRIHMQPGQPNQMPPPQMPPHQNPIQRPVPQPNYGHHQQPPPYLNRPHHQSPGLMFPNYLNMAGNRQHGHIFGIRQPQPQPQQPYDMGGQRLPPPQNTHRVPLPAPTNLMPIEPARAPQHQPASTTSTTTTTTTGVPSMSSSTTTPTSITSSTTSTTPRPPLSSTTTNGITVQMVFSPAPNRPTVFEPVRLSSMKGDGHKQGGTGGSGGSDPSQNLIVDNSSAPTSPNGAVVVGGHSVAGPLKTTIWRNTTPTSSTTTTTTTSTTTTTTPAPLTPSTKTPITPSDSWSKTSPNPWDLFKVSGCNIYGTMYKVNEEVEEISTACKRCMCSTFGVKCRTIC